MRTINWRALSLALITSLIIICIVALIGFYTNVVFIDNTGGLQQYAETFASTGGGLLLVFPRPNLVYYFVVLQFLLTLVLYFVYKKFLPSKPLSK